jgi:hypothetical protein
LSTEPLLTVPGDAPLREADAGEPGIVPVLRRWFLRNRESLPASLALHALLLGVALMAFPTHPIQAPPPESMSVEVLTPEEFAKLAPLLPPPQHPETPAVTAPSAPPSNAPPASPDLVAPRMPLEHATRILSGGALDAIARKSLRSLDGDARFEQLCDIEAMEQIASAERTDFKPEKTIAYAVEDTKLAGDTLVADGAAFLSKGHWYHLAFRCRSTPDRRKILSFDFATGGQFPDDDPSLPAGDED